MKTFLLLPLLLVLCSTACKKKEPEPYIRTTSITVGNYTDMVTTTVDTLVVYSVQPGYLDLDVDKDHVADFRLSSTIWGSPGLGYHKRSELFCLSKDASLSGYFKTDTLFIAFDSTTYMGDDGKVHMNYFERLSFITLDSNYKPLVIRLNMFKIKVKMVADKIGIQDVFESDSLILMNESYSFPPYTTIRNDTVIHRVLIDYNNQYTFPQDEVNYIAFKIMHGMDIKYGWIKLTVADKNKLTIFETAIQK